MTRTRRTLLTIAATAALALVGATPAHATTTAALSGVTLHDPSPAQDAVYDSVHHFWIVAQCSYPGAAGEITLNKVSPTGALLGYMKLKGAWGHGLSIGVEPVGATTYIWTEAVGKPEPALGAGANPGVYGTRIARFAWVSGRSIYATSSGVSIYAGNQPAETPSVDAARNLIAIHYWSSGTFRFVVYSLAAFKAHSYVPLSHGIDPPYAATSQGWSLVSGHAFVRLEGDAYGPTNPTGNTALTTLSMTGKVLERHAVTAMPGLTYREPEGVTQVGFVVCLGFATEPGGTWHKLTELCGA
jgi:hypothetical protein